MAVKTVSRIGALLVATVALLISVQNIPKVLNAERLREDYVSARGSITSKNVGQHGIVDYAFEVDGRKYDARGVGGEDREYGSNVTVYYFSGDPSLSSLHDPLVWRSPTWRTVFGPLVVGAVAFCVGFGWIGSYRTRDDKKPNQAPEPTAPSGRGSS
jgi:hypothetical protein